MATFQSRWVFGLLLLGLILVASSNDTDLEDTQVEEEGEVEEAPKPEVIDGGDIQINIQPVEASEFDCEGLEDGIHLQDAPKDCLWFYICMQGAPHKIECPKIQNNLQTYFNPIKRVCDNVDPDFCITFAQKNSSEEEDLSSDKTEL